jgi:transcriptional regulator with XRE-family HTH domain
MMVEVTNGTFADVLKQYRAAAALTQEELAERAGLSVRAISDLERGIKRHPYPHTVQRLVVALGLSGNDVLILQRAAPRLDPRCGRERQPRSRP